MAQLHLSVGYLTTLGMWPPRYSLPKERHRWWNSTILYNFYSIFMILHTSSCGVQAALAIYFYDLTFEEVVVGGCNGWVLLFATLKLCLFCARRDMLRCLVERCYEMYEKIHKSASEEALAIIRKRARYARSVSLACVIATTITALGLWFGPKMELLFRTNLSNNATREKIFFERYGIPVIEYFPLDTNEYFTFCNVYELFNCLLAGYAVASPDVFIYSVMIALWAQYEVVCSMFADLNQTSSQFEIGEHNFNLSTREINTTENGLRKAIRHHAAVLKLGREIEMFCHPFMAFQIMLSGGVICFTIYQLSKVTSLYSPIFIVMLQYFLMGNILALCVCYFAHCVRSTSMAVTFAIYSSDWFQQNSSFRRQILFCIQVSQQSINLTALKTLNVSLELFLKVLKNSYSGFALIKHAESPRF